MQHTDIAALLMEHAIETWGMTPTTPDTCLCGERLMPLHHPDGHRDPPSIARRRAFAEHVATARQHTEPASPEPLLP